jgi:hypothetical protein
MKASLVVASILLVGARGEIGPTPSRTVKICIESGPAEPLALMQAQATASQIFATIGVAIDWRHTVRLCGNRSEDTILIRLSTGANPERYPGALAYAELSGASRVEVFYDRVVAMVAPRRVAVVLGHVLAHEAAHILEDVNRHSAQGIMKAHWVEGDYLDMAWKHLAFTSEDAELIHLGIDARASRLASRK